MKALLKITLAFAIAGLALPLCAGEIIAQFEEVESFTDFSISGLSEQKTLKIFQSEMEDELQRLADKYLNEEEILTLVFTDIDMAGDIQPWRNRHSADIRYVESVYPPRLKFRYKLEGPEGKLIDEGEVATADLAFDFSVIAPMRSRSSNFYYELNLLGDWLRRSIRDIQSAEIQP